MMSRYMKQRPKWETDKSAYVHTGTVMCHTCVAGKTKQITKQKHETEWREEVLLRADH